VTLLFCMLLAVQPRFLGPPEKKPDAGAPPAVQAGDTAPPLAGEVENPAGSERSFDLAAMLGPAATEPSRAVLVARQLAGEYGPRGLRAVVVDVGTDDRQAASRALVEVEGAGIPVLGDRGQVQARRWLGSRPQLPALFVVDRDGAVGAMAGACGPEAVTSLRAAIENALAR